MEFSHLDENGVKMVNVVNKDKTERTAIATGEVRLSQATIELIKDSKTPKGDVLNTARIAGIQAAKKNGADFIAEPTEIDKLIALQPSDECGIDCVMDKVKTRLNAGGLTQYDEKRLKKRLKELQKQYDAEMEAIEKEFAEAAD